MAELEAAYFNPENKQIHIWRKVFPDGSAKITLGRCPLTDTRRPPEMRSDWAVPEDAEISSIHADLTWKDPILTVTRRPNSKNFIYHRKDPLLPPEAIGPGDSFAVVSGDSFQIGNTQFTFQCVSEAPSGDADPQPNPEMTIQVSELRKNAFHNGDLPLQALLDIPDLIRSVNLDQLMDHTLNVVMKGVRKADVAAIVTLDRSDPKARPATRRSKHRGSFTQDFRASNLVVRKALQHRFESLFYIWDGKESISHQFVSTSSTGLDWALCVPLPKLEQKETALYIAGMVPPGLRDHIAKDPELRDAQKFVDLVAELYSAAQERSQLERNITQFKRFLPERMVQMMNQGNLEKYLEPKLAPVTVLFCDLRGSCGLAEAGEQDLLDSWARISDALEIMSSAITEREGVIGDLQGDAVMGFWGWPQRETETPQHQIENAALAALQIRKDFTRQEERRKTSFQCGIGIAHGLAVAGKLGVYEQFKIDVFGPVVNLAARLESLTKHFGVKILVDEKIANALLANSQSQWQLRTLARVRPAGMQKSTQVSELSAGNSYSGELIDLWNGGVSAFLEKDWERAKRRFDKYRKWGNIQNDRPLALLEEYMTKIGTPPADWDSTIAMENK